MCLAHSVAAQSSAVHHGDELLMQSQEIPAVKADEDLHEVAHAAVMQVSPVVSVQMLVYNHEPFLAEAIEGVVKQQCSYPFELVIGEDCSTDRSRAIALDYQARYPGIIRVLFSDRNVGMLPNARRVRARSRGRYIAFCEGDDYWIDPYKLQHQVDVLEARSDVTAVFTDFVSADLVRGKWVVDSSNAFAGLTDDQLRGDLRSATFDGGGRFRTLTSVYRASVFDALAARRLPTDSFPFGDAFNVAQAIATGNIERLDRVTAVYRRSPGSATRGNVQRNLRFIEAARRFHEQIHVFFPELAPASPLVLAQWDRSICRAAYMAGDAAAFDSAYKRLQFAQQPLPAYLPLLKVLIRIPALRNATVRARSHLRGLVNSLKAR